jgi:hypothetical protein
MNKTPAYYFEKYIGLFLALVFTILCFRNWSYCSFICAKDFFDKVIGITTTLFGFLLAVLTLIVQSNSTIIQEMRAFGSYNRLISFNKKIVVLSAIICLVSLILLLTREQLVKDSPDLLKWFSSVNFLLFMWTCFDTLIFILIFYKLISSENK